ncbi:MAG: hypothetical protein WCJ30_14715, partial [Deltaproteobacteria bacterium]
MRNHLGLAGITALVAGCFLSGGGGGGSGGGGGGGQSGNEGFAAACASADYGATQSAQKLEAFLSATAVFVATASDLDRSLNDACTRMAGDLGIPAGELAPASPDVPATRAACTRVALQIHDEMAAIRGAGNAQLQVSATPPVCHVSVDAYAQCVGQCDVHVTPGQVPVCEGGELRGQCSAQCTGRCSVEVNGQCSGRCEGSCSASCTGVCQGTCEGTCAVRAADGSCNGACQGTCRGSCSAGCTGSCQGSCEVSAQARCSGECRGGCSVQYTEPRCTGRLVPPQVDADCRASCDARINAQATCTPGTASVVFSSGLSPELQARATRLRTALVAGLPAIRSAGEKLQRLQASGATMVNTAGSIPLASLARIGARAEPVHRDR